MFASLVGANEPLIIAHRGSSDAAPENTLTAFRLAFEQGADGVEGDFHLTADEQIVCIHDSNTRRTGGRTLVVADNPLSKLRQLEYGRWKGERFSGEPLPTFLDVVAVVPTGKRFVVELKTGPEIVPPLRRAIQHVASESSDGGQPDWLIISFNADTIAACKRALPDLPAHWLTSFKRDKLTGRVTPTADQIVEVVKRCGADGVGMQARRDVIDDAFVDRLALAGVRDFHVWTIDDPEAAKYFRRLGASGITTNRPLPIRAAFQR